ncbi:MAG TPA: glutathione S-transferase [Polyangiaceae bacterium]|jgi:glutathione S-transferase
MSGEFTLYVWNYNHASWSMRAGIALRQTGAKFREISARESPDALTTVKAATPTGLLPVLEHGEQLIWDSLAIGEYLAEQFPNAGLWPSDPAARAPARSMVAEMHSGFNALREFLPMNIRAHYPGYYKNPATRREIARVTAMWSECLARFGGKGPFLFGAFSLVDAFYTPVVMRFTSYDVALPPELAAYAKAVRAQPYVQDWLERARAEQYTNPVYVFEC